MVQARQAQLILRVRAYTNNDSSLLQDIGGSGLLLLQLLVRNAEDRLLRGAPGTQSGCYQRGRQPSTSKKSSLVWESGARGSWL